MPEEKKENLEKELNEYFGKTEDLGEIKDIEEYLDWYGFEE